VAHLPNFLIPTKVKKAPKLHAEKIGADIEAKVLKSAYYRHTEQWYTKQYFALQNLWEQTDKHTQEAERQARVERRLQQQLQQCEERE